MKLKRSFWCLLLITIVAGFLRFYRLAEVPPSLFGDEVDVGYQAYSLLKTGKDYMGQPWPVYIHSLVEWRAPLLMYVTVPFVWLFGLTELGVRFAPVLFGVLCIPAMYLLLRELFTGSSTSPIPQPFGLKIPNPKGFSLAKFSLGSPSATSGVSLGLLGALLLAINPWHIHYSRAAFEVTLLLLLILGGTYFFLRGLKNSWFFLGSAVFLGLAPYTYSTANVFLPLLLLSFLLIYRKELIKLKDNREVWISLAIFLVILVPIAREIFFGQAGSRFGLISVFSDQKIIEEIHLKRLGGVSFQVEPTKVSFTDRIFINRPVYWGLAIAQNYLASFSPEFLFSRGDQYFRHAAGKVGEFYLVEIFLVVLGALSLLKLKGEAKWLVFAWLFLSPIPSALTQNGGNHATRLFIMIPPLVILSSRGLLQLIKVVESKKASVFLLFVVCIGLMFNFSFYLHRYFVHYPRESWRYWHYGYKQTFQWLKQRQGEFDKVLVNNTYEPALIRYLFWTKYDPAKFQQEFIDDETREDILPGFDGFQLGKVYFGKPNKKGWWKDILTPGVLYVVSQQEDIGGDWNWQKDPPSGVKVLTTINNPYNQPIFYLVTHD